MTENFSDFLLPQDDNAVVDDTPPVLAEPGANEAAYYDPATHEDATPTYEYTPEAEAFVSPIQQQRIFALQMVQGLGLTSAEDMTKSADVILNYVNNGNPA